MGRISLAVGLAMALATVAGCGSSGSTLIKDLQQTGLAFHNYHDANSKGPANWDELIAFANSAGGDGQVIARVRDAGYQMKWDVRLSEVTEGTSNTVLAENPSNGPKLMMDGSVQK